MSQHADTHHCAELPIYYPPEMLSGEGTTANPWQLTPEKMFAAVRQLSWTRKTIFFRAGIYECPEPIEINFADHSR
jgi:hypothetical protein